MYDDGRDCRDLLRNQSISSATNFPSGEKRNSLDIFAPMQSPQKAVDHDVKVSEGYI